MQTDWRTVLEKTHPNSEGLPLTMHAAQLLIMGGHRTEAVAALQELVERDPNNLQALEQLAALLQRLARLTEARQVQKKLALAEAKRYGIHTPDLLEVTRFLEASNGLSLAPQAAPIPYVTSLFDRSAKDFENLLRSSLAYNAPELLLAACQSLGSFRLVALEILDLGCGTGLAGEIFRPFATRLDGVDLSTKMLDIARNKLLYDELYASDIVPHLDNVNRQYSLILAADVFVYIGDLAPVFSAIRNRLVPGGHFAFTVETSATTDYCLQANRRYAHSKIYLELLGADHQFEVELLEDTSIRMESSKPVPSILAIMRVS
jgi:predicted TPR repeat methyltransferase